MATLPGDSIFLLLQQNAHRTKTSHQIKKDCFKPKVKVLVKVFGANFSETKIKDLDFHSNSFLANCVCLSECVFLSAYPPPPRPLHSGTV